MEHPVHPELPGGDLHCIEPGQSNPLAEDPSAVGRDVAIVIHM